MEREVEDEGVVEKTCDREENDKKIFSCYVEFTNDLIYKKLHKEMKSDAKRQQAEVFIKRF